MRDPMNLEGRSAIVTGSTKGIGKGIALSLAKAGADVCVTARSAPHVERVAAEVEALGRRALRVQADVTKEDDVQRLADAALKAFGKVDILVNNVGGDWGARFLVPVHGYRPRSNDPAEMAPMPLDEWRRVMDLNLTSTFLCCRAVGPHMLTRQKGKVINISSSWGSRSGRRRMLYAVAKAALNILTVSLAQEWARHHINVNAISSGLVVTTQEPDLIKKMVETLPMRRAAEPWEIGELAVYLASDASDYMTGQVIGIDGGQLLI